MSNVKQISLACGLAAAVWFGGAPALAADGVPPMSGQQQQQWHGHRGHRAQGWLRGVQLTDAQRDQVFQLVHEQAPAMHDKFMKLRHIRTDLRKTTMSDQYDASRVSKLASDEAQIRVGLTLIRAELHHNIYMLLTPEQKKQLLQRQKAPSSR